MMNFLKRHWWQILIVLVLIGAILLTLWFLVQNSKLKQPAFLSNKPRCTANLEGILTSPIVKLDDLAFIVPLGNLNPPGHVIPTDHQYWIRQDEQNPNKKVEIYSPGDIVLSNLTESKTFDGDELINSDYTIELSPCNGLLLALGHVRELTSTLEKIKSEGKATCHDGKKPGGYLNKQCDYALKYKTKSGELLGWAGGSEDSPGIDVGLYNKNIKPLNFANRARYQDDNLQAACPMDLYSGSLKEKLSEKLGGHDKKRTIEPRCGEVMQDVVGTLQGNWFKGKNKDWEVNSSAVSLVHENDDPSVAVVSLGDDFKRSGKIAFVPRDSGTINREFSQIKPDNKIYCFQSNEEYNQPGNQYYIPGKVVLELLDNTHLKIELIQNSKCTATERFVNPVIYER